jgi:hypothetical protein
VSALRHDNPAPNYVAALIAKITISPNANTFIKILPMSAGLRLPSRKVFESLKVALAANHFVSKNIASVTRKGSSAVNIASASTVKTMSQ